MFDNQNQLFMKKILSIALMTFLLGCKNSGTESKSKNENQIDTAAMLSGVITTTEGEKTIELIAQDTLQSEAIVFEEFEGEYISKTLSLKANESQTSEKYTIASFSGWPEFAMKMVKRCWKERNGLFKVTVCAKTKMPHRRTCKKTAYLEIKYPGNLDNATIETIQKCTKIGVAAAAAVSPGGPEAMGPAFETAFNACVTAEVATKVSFTIKIDTECGKWKPY